MSEALAAARAEASRNHELLQRALEDLKQLRTLLYSDPASEPFVLPTAMLKALRFRGKFELEQATYADTVMKGVTLRLLLDDQGLRSEAPK